MSNGKLRVLASVALIFSLSSCGGDDAYEEMAGPAQKLAEKIQNEVPTPNAAMPTSGTATYKGYASMTIGSGADPDFALSRLTMDADFASGNISGAMSDFAIEEGGTVSGTLPVNGSFTPGTSGLTATAAGQLNGGAIDAALLLNGNFLGSNSQYVGGSVSGTVTSGGTTSTISYGRFGGEKQ